MKSTAKLLTVGVACASIGIFVVAGWAVYPPAQHGIKATAVVEDEVIVKFKTGAAAAGISAAHGKFQARSLLKLAGVGADVVKLPAKKSLAELNKIVEEYKKDPNVEYAEVNGIMTALQAPEIETVGPGPDDPGFAQLWGIKKILANYAWGINVGAGNIKVAVVDTGVDYTHQDLIGTVIKGYDYVNNDADPKDDHGHGTHVSGTIAATINNNVGVVGVAPNVKILAVKVCTSGGSCPYSAIANGVIYAANEGVRVINLSLGGGPSLTVKSAVDYAWSKNVLVACAAGNSGAGPPGYPAAYPSCLAVAATDQNDARASFSQYAPEGVAAPGVAIYSSLPGNQYASWNGTSMATPHVAGLAGLLFSQNPARSNARVRQILTTTTVDLGAAGKDGIFGYGRINAYKAAYGCGAASCP